MNGVIHDPYLNTAKRSLEDKRYKERYEREKVKRINNFLNQKIEITDYIHLSEGMAKFVVFISFLTLPYIIGVGFIFFIIAKTNLETFKSININEYIALWAIGYEVIASFLLLIIIKSAISFQQS